MSKTNQGKIMSGRPPLKASIARSADHKVFITEAEKAITKIVPEVTGKSASDFIRDGFIDKLRIFLKENPELIPLIEERLNDSGYKLPSYLK